MGKEEIYPKFYLDSLPAQLNLFSEDL